MNEWISVKDRLPEIPEGSIASTYKLVHTTDDSGNWDIARYQVDKKWYWGAWDTCHVDYWMEIPELPKNKKK